MKKGEWPKCPVCGKRLSPRFSSPGQWLCCCESDEWDKLIEMGMELVEKRVLALEWREINI